MARDRIEHHLNSSSLANALVSKKAEQGLSRPHPDLPEVKEATLYWVMKELTTTTRDRATSGMHMSGSKHVEGEDAKELASKAEDMMTLARSPLAAGTTAQHQVPKTEEVFARGKGRKGKGKGSSKKANTPTAI